jgi:hypothetical protein
MTLDRSGKRDKHEFLWRDLALHLGRRRQPALELVADATYPDLYRIHPDGWMSTPANLTRAKDAAYGHARYLLGRLRPAEAPCSPEAQAA